MSNRASSSDANQWVKQQISNYRLNRADVIDWLTKKFGEYDWDERGPFMLEVSYSMVESTHSTYDRAFHDQGVLRMFHNLDSAGRLLRILCPSRT